VLLLGQSVGKTRVGHPSPENMSQRRVFATKARCIMFTRQNCGIVYELGDRKKSVILAAAQYSGQIRLDGLPPN